MTPSSDGDVVRARLKAIGRRMTRRRYLARATDALAACAALGLCLLALGHAVPAAAGALPIAIVLVACAGLAWILVSRAPEPHPLRLAAWRCDRALGLPQQVLAVLEEGRDAVAPAPRVERGGFADAIARKAARHLERASDEVIAPCAPGPRAGLAAAAMLACACMLVAGGWPTRAAEDPDPSAARTRAADALTATSHALAQVPTAADAARRLAHAARVLAQDANTPDAIERARAALTGVGAERDRARAADEAVRALAQDPALAKIQAALAAADEHATSEATEALSAALAGAGAGNEARASVARALEDAARAAEDAALERPLLRLAALAAHGTIDAPALTQFMAELARRARAEGPLALAHAEVSRALAGLDATAAASGLDVSARPGSRGPNALDPRGATGSDGALTGDASGGTGAGGSPDLAAPAFLEPAVLEPGLPPAAGSSVAGPGRAARAVSLVDRALVDAYLYGTASR